jgi:quinol monooxygenase YgiN
MMLIFLLKITPPPTRRREVLDILKNVQGPTSAKPGCLACEIYEGVGDDQAILYMEHWRSAVDLQYHIQSVIYARLLAAMDLSSIRPEINFCEISKVQGMGLIESLRTQRGHSDSRSLES